MDSHIIKYLDDGNGNIDWSRHIINKDDVGVYNVVISSEACDKRIDTLANMMGVSDINKILIVNELMNPFAVEGSQEYMVPNLPGENGYYYQSDQSLLGDDDGEDAAKTITNILK